MVEKGISMQSIGPGGVPERLMWSLVAPLPQFIG